MSNLKQLAHDYALQLNTVTIGGCPIKQKELHDAIDIIEQENKELKQKLNEQVVYAQILHKALLNVSKCHESDLVRYVKSVDEIVTEALCRHEDPATELLQEIQFDAVNACADAIGHKSTNPMLMADTEQFYIDCAEQVYDYANTLIDDKKASVS